MQEIRVEIRKILNEAFGVPGPILDYVQAIKDAIISKIKKGEQENGIFFSNHKLNELGFSEIGSYKDSYVKFPLRAIQVNYRMEFGSDGAFEYETYGSYIKKASSVGNKIVNTPAGQANLMTLNIKLDATISINKNITSPHIEKIADSVQDFLMHELTHVYEDYQKVSKNSNFSTGPEILNYAVDKHRNSENKNWRNFISAIYFTLPHEINAKVAEFYSHVVGLRKQGLTNEQIIDSLKTNYTWKYVNQLINFDYHKFIAKLTASIPGEDVNAFLDKHIKNFQADVADYVSEIQKELGEKNTSLAKMSRMSVTNFLKTWETIFKEKGLELKKKMSRVISHS